MRRTSCYFILTIILFLAVFPIYGEFQDGFEFSIQNEEVVIESYSGQDSVVIIPDSLNNLPVTVIGDNSFADNELIVQITLPNTIRKIGNNAFAGCGQMKSINFPSTIRQIGESSFSGCEKLTQITLPKDLESIGRNAFQDCSNIYYVTDATGGNLTEIGEGAFDDTAWFKNFNNDYVTICQGCFLLKYRGKETNLTVPWTIYNIAEGAFSGNESIVTMQLPNYMTTLQAGAISDMKNLKTINGGNGIETVSEYAFSNLPELENINLNNAELDTENFMNCPGSPYGSENDAPYDMTMPDDADLYFQSVFDENENGVVITHCSNSVEFQDGTVIFPDYIRTKRVVAIDIGACQNRLDIKKVVLPKYLTSIRSWAFSYDANLSEVVLNEALQKIESDAFNGCAVDRENLSLDGVIVHSRAFYQSGNKGGD